MKAKKENIELDKSATDKAQVLKDLAELLPAESKPVDEVIGNIGENITIPKANDLPEVVINNETQKSTVSTSLETQSEINPYGTDSEGIAWDSALHFADGRKTPLGKFRKQRGGYRNELQNNGVQPQNAISVEASGKAFSALFFTLGCGLFGNEFAPENEGEKAMVDEPIKNYVAVSGIKDLPPGIALAIALVAYTGSKLAAKETVRENAIKKFDWLKKLFKRG
jgi:hypothetical protein